MAAGRLRRSIPGVNRPGAAAPAALLLQAGQDQYVPALPLQVLHRLAENRPARGLGNRRAHGVPGHERGSEKVAGADGTVQVRGQTVDGAGERDPRLTLGFSERTERDPGLVVAGPRDDAGHAPIIWLSRHAQVTRLARVNDHHRPCGSGFYGRKGFGEVRRSRDKPAVTVKHVLGGPSLIEDHDAPRPQIRDPNDHPRTRCWHRAFVDRDGAVAARVRKGGGGHRPAGRDDLDDIERLVRGLRLDVGARAPRVGRRSPDHLPCVLVERAIARGGRGESRRHDNRNKDSAAQHGRPHVRASRHGRPPDDGARPLRRKSRNRPYARELSLSNTREHQHGSTNVCREQMSGQITCQRHRPGAARTRAGRMIHYAAVVMSSAALLHPPKASPRGALHDIPFVAFDTETTGLHASDRLVELAAVRFRGDDVEGEWSTLVDPGTAIPAEATLVHGIRNRDVAGSPPAAEALPGFLDFIQGAALVGHNAPFDIRVLAHELLRAGLPLPDNPVLDTCAIPRRLQLDVPNHRLATLAHRFGVPQGRGHRALADARVARGLLEAYLRDLGPAVESLVRLA